jgi:hypothetical protein
MFGSDVFDILVGLVFVYLLASLIVSAGTELIAGWLGWRAEKLLDGIRNLINSPEAADWAQKLYTHPLIQGMSPLPTKAFSIRGFKLAPAPPGPSYIPSRTFSTALIGLVQNSEPAIGNAVKGLQGLMNTIPDSKTSSTDIKKVVSQLAGDIPAANPPNAVQTRFKSDLQALADKIPDSTVSLSQLATGLQTTANKLSDTDPTQVNLKASLQNLIANAQGVSGTVDQLKNNLQSLINGISDYSAPVLLVKNDLQTLLKSTPGEADSAAAALELVRVFVNNAWGRYLADIIDKLPNGKLRTALGDLLQQAGGDFEKFKGAVEAWFDDSMDRVSGWYKRHTQWVQVIFAVALALALNLDSISIVRALSKDNSGLLKATVAEAQKFPATMATASEPQDILRLLDTEFSSLALPIGWTQGPPAGSKDNSDFRQWPGWPWEFKNWFDTITHHLIGWLLTVIAVSLGAPFWFDLLSRFISIRASGDPPPEPSKSQNGSDGSKKNG